MLTTDVTCLKDINAEAVPKLQAGFRQYYAKDIPGTKVYANEKSFLECLLEAIDLHVCVWYLFRTRNDEGGFKGLGEVEDWTYVNQVFVERA